MEIPKQVVSDVLDHRLGLKLKLIYSILGLVLGLACILSGSILGLAGVTGHTNFIASLLGLSVQLNDAAPGVVIFIVGIFMVRITKFNVNHAVMITVSEAPTTSTSTPNSKIYPEGLTLAEAKELEAQVIKGTKIFSAISVIAHILSYVYTPWLDGRSSGKRQP